MQYKTELHAHTSEVSTCADFTAPEVAERYIAAGYTTLVLTNHFTSKIIKPMGADWDQKIDYFVAPYRHMKEYAKGRLNVILGCELFLDESAEKYLHLGRNEYLLYGPVEEFLRANPDLQQRKLKELLPLAHEWGVLVIQAHPFRSGTQIVNPDRVDGYEVFNAHPKQDARNHQALAWARLHGKIMTSGSDFHHPYSPEAGGILSDVPVTDSVQLTELLRSGQYTLLCGGPAAERDGMCDMPATQE